MAIDVTWHKLQISKKIRPTNAILQVVKSPYLNDKSSEFDQIWYTNAYLELDSQMTT